MMENEVEFSPKGKRKLSLFVAKGLVYQYLCNELDSERRSSFESALKEYPELAENLRLMTLGLSMTQKLESISISEDLSENLKLTTDYFDSLKSKVNFDKLPPALKLGVEGLFIALAVATLAIVIPWNSLLDMNLGPRKVILTEVVRNSEAEKTIESPQAEQSTVEYPDDTGIQKTVEAVGANSTSNAQSGSLISKAEVPTVAVKPAKDSKTDQAGKMVPVTDVKVPPAVAPTKPAESTQPTQSPVAVAKDQEKTVVSSTAENKNGVLYRGTIYVTNFKAITPKLVEKLQELGGRKAGQVELGWFKGESSYFHFTMPDSKYDELAAFFNTYGSLVIQKEPHERVMPDGIRRVIITVYEKK